MGFFAQSGILNRRSFFGGVQKAFLPTDISGCKLWVSADYGVTTGLPWISQIVISGCDPSTSDGTYTRASATDAQLDSTTNSNFIYFDDPYWNLRDAEYDDDTFYNTGNLAANSWSAFVGTFGTAVNTNSTIADVVYSVTDRSLTNNLIHDSDVSYMYISNNILNGKPAFNCDGGRLSCDDIVTAKTIYSAIKIKDDVPGAYAVIVEATGGGLYSNVNLNWGSYFSGSVYAPDSFEPNTPYIIGTISDDGNNYKLRQNGSTVNENSNGNGFYSRSKLYFGNDSSNGQQANCYVCEAIVYDKALTISEAEQVESYLNSKYAVY